MIGVIFFFLTDMIFDLIALCIHGIMWQGRFTDRDVHKLKGDYLPAHDTLSHTPFDLAIAQPNERTFLTLAY